MIYNNDTIRQLERSSIRAFMERNRQYLKGRVFDFGAGKQPYKDLVEGEYVPYEKGDPFPYVQFDTVMSNQVIQYMPDPSAWLKRLCGILKPDGYLVLTGPTNWPEVEVSDLHRFTETGIIAELLHLGLKFISVESRAEIDLNGCKFSLGYGAVAQRS